MKSILRVGLILLIVALAGIGIALTLNMVNNQEAVRALIKLVYILAIVIGAGLLVILVTKKPNGQA